MQPRTLDALWAHHEGHRRAQRTAQTLKEVTCGHSVLEASKAKN